MKQEWNRGFGAIFVFPDFRRFSGTVLKETNQTKTNKTRYMIGYNHKDLFNHITKHENYKEDVPFHIDHIFPVKAFMDYKIYDLKIINALDNLRPLSVFENLSKADKYDKEEFEKWLKTKGVIIE